MVTIMQVSVPATIGQHSAMMPEGARGLSVMNWISVEMIAYIIADTARPMQPRTFHVVGVGTDITDVVRRHGRFVGSVKMDRSYHVFLEDF